MPTVIDSLVVTLGLDPAKFTQGQKDALASFKKTQEEATRTAKEMEARGKQAATFFTGVRNAAMGLFSVLTGAGIKEFVEHTMTSVAATGRLAHNIGVASGDLNAFTNMVERNGGSADAAAASYKSLSDAIEQYRVTGQGSDQFLTAMGQIGATGQESPLEILKKFNKFTQGQTPQYANMVGRWLGLDQGSINQALKSVEQFNADLEKSYALGVQTEKDVEAAKRLQEAWKGIGQQIENVLLQTQTKWTPVLANIIEQTSKWVKNNREVATTIGEIATALAVIFALKPALWFLQLMGASLAKSPMLVGLAAMFHSSELNKGEDEEVAKLKAMGKGGGRNLLGIVRKLEGSKDDAVSPAGAVGRYQIMPATARLYGFDPSRLKDPEYNTQVATAILEDLNKKYHGNVDQILANYNSSPKGTKRFMKTGDPSTLPVETQKYLAHAHRLLSSKPGADAGTSSSVHQETHIGSIVVQTKATDAEGIGRDLKGVLQKINRHETPLNTAIQANTGLN